MRPTLADLEQPALDPSRSIDSRTRSVHQYPENLQRRPRAGISKKEGKTKQYASVPYCGVLHWRGNRARNAGRLLGGARRVARQAARTRGRRARRLASNARRPEASMTVTSAIERLQGDFGTLSALLGIYAAERPTDEVLAFEDQGVSYAELDTQVDRV